MSKAFSPKPTEPTPAGPMRCDGDFAHFLKQERDEVHAELQRLEAERARLEEAIAVLRDEIQEAEALLAEGGLPFVAAP